MIIIEHIFGIICLISAGLYAGDKLQLKDAIIIIVLLILGSNLMNIKETLI